MNLRPMLPGLLLLASAASAAGPLAFPELPEAAYTPLETSSFNPVGSRLELETATGRVLKFDVSTRLAHPNGDTTVSGHGDRSRLVATIGPAGAFGHLRMDGKDFAVTTDRNGTWLVELPAAGVTYNHCGLANGSAARPATAGSPVPAATGDPLARVIDLLLIYNQAMADRYPGALLATRLNHFIAIGNQVLANSNIALGLRVVGMELFNYRNDNSNAELLTDMAATLAGETVAGLLGLRQRRDALGADLVIMVRPHDIEQRGSCGIAFLPDNNPAFGVNVVSDGMSSWSLCLDDVLIHEIGHNLGAGHQAGFGGGVYDPRGAAFVNPGQYGTVMGSFGTGRPDRFRGLPVFSNPDVQCGGQPCGSNALGELANNAAVIRSTMSAVANYRQPASNVPLPVELPRATDDSDADGVADWDDHFPFDASEQSDTDLDGTGDLADIFPLDAAEQLDLDGDAIGNNADTDDDGDGVTDGIDDFPLDAFEFIDTDGDGVGDNADALPFNPDEFLDTDLDGTGNHADVDDDDDGVPELDANAQDVLVVSVGNNRVLRFDAGTGEIRGVEVPPWDSLLTFQSSLAYRPSDQTLLYLGDSSVRRLDLLTRELLGVYVPAYEDDPFAPQLGTGFPTGIAALDGGRRFAVTRMDEAEIAFYRGGNRAEHDNMLDWAIGENESPIDIVGNGSTAIILGQANRAIYQGTESGAGLLGRSPNDWMLDPYRMARTGDGRLLISDQLRNSVVALDAGDGSFLGDLAVLGNHGYSNPTGIAVTRGGELLVAGADQDVILRFDAGSGAFLGELVGSGFGGLMQPHAMTLVPQLADRFNADPDRVIRPNPGLWFDRRTDGRGFDIQVFRDRLSVIWYTYDDDGSPTWYLGAGDLIGLRFEASLLRFQMDDAGAVTFTTAGAIALSFESERKAQASWSIGAHTGEESLQWIVFTPDPARQDLTGLWGRDDGPGWGVSLAQQGEVSVAIAYIYGAEGRPRWVISDPFRGAAPLRLDMNASFSDTLCPSCSGVSAYEFLPAGTMQLMLPGGAWNSDVALPAPLTGDWILDQAPIRLFSDPSVRPR